MEGVQGVDEGAAVLEVGLRDIQLGGDGIHDLSGQNATPVVELGRVHGGATSDLEVGEFEPAQSVDQLDAVALRAVVERVAGPLGLDIEDLECFAGGGVQRVGCSRLDDDDVAIGDAFGDDAGWDIEGSHMTSLLLLNHRWRHNDVQRLTVT